MRKSTIGLSIGLAFDLVLVLAVGLQSRVSDQCLSAVLGYAPCSPSQPLAQGILFGLLCMSPFLVMAPAAGYGIGRRTDMRRRHRRRRSSGSMHRQGGKPPEERTSIPGL